MEMNIIAASGSPGERRGGEERVQSEGSRGGAEGGDAIFPSEGAEAEEKAM